MTHSPRDVLLDLFQTAVATAMPHEKFIDVLPEKPTGKVVVIGAGKGAAAMAQGLEAAWPDVDLSGQVITRYDHGAPCTKINVIEAAHPVPDAAGQQAAQDILKSVSGLSEQDLVICLISGGGSALMALPAQGITLEDKQQINKALLKSGASISEINCVRKHLSAVKGGRLARACAPARVVSLMISDVPRDDLSVIASGPTVGDPTTCRDALAILQRYGISVPVHIREMLEDGSLETPKPNDPVFERVENHLIATPQGALEAAAEKARALGYNAYILSDEIEGESREVAKVLGAIAKQTASRHQPFVLPCVILSGGETTVTVRGTGRGGRNAEFLLSLAQVLDGRAGVYALACDTDGIDGSEDNAGAMLMPDSLERADQLGMKVQAYLDNNDGYGFFDGLGDLIVTGPTRTNVNDFRAILIDQQAKD